MKIVMTGASGLVGSALTSFLANHGHQVVGLTRGARPADLRQPSWIPVSGEVQWAGAGPFEAAINLSGETIAQRWTPAAKARIRDSRVDSTRVLSEALARLPQPPSVLISASATGYYGECGKEIVDERSASGAGFLADVCREWEAATHSASELGIRVVNLRIGVVLASSGGALGKMLPAFRLGVGGKLGSGRQYWSWVGMDDLMAIILQILLNPALSGPVNAVSPFPVTNAEFTHTLGAVLRRPTLVTVPAFVLKLLFGEMAEAALLGSCRVRPARLEETGYRFQFPELEGALRLLLGKEK